MIHSWGQRLVIVDPNIHGVNKSSTGSTLKPSNALKVISKIFKSVQDLTDIQCKFEHIGVVWSYFSVHFKFWAQTHPESVGEIRMIKRCTSVKAGKMSKICLIIPRPSNTDAYVTVTRTVIKKSEAAVTPDASYFKNN